MKRQFNLRFFLIFGLACLIVGGGAAYAHSLQIRRQAEYLLKRGHEAEANGEIEKAAEYYVKYLAFRPDDADARGRFGMILVKRAVTPKQKLAAFLTLEKALRDDPNLKDVRRKAVEVAIEIEQYDDARVNVEALLAASPGDPELMEQLGRCLEAAGRNQEAIDQYESVVRKLPNRVKIYQQLASLYGRADQSIQAEKTLDTMVENNPESIPARLIRFHYKRALGDPKSLEAALVDLSFAQRIANPGESEADLILASAEMAIEGKDLDKARQLLARGLLLSKKDIRIPLELARLEVRENRRAEALQVLNEAKKESRGDPAIDWMIASMMIEANDAAGAEKIVEELKGKIVSVMIEFLTARIKMNRDEYGEAVRILEKCRPELARSPEALATELLLADCYEKLGQIDRRLEACNRAIQLDRSSKPARLRLAATQIAMGQIEDGIREYQKLRDREPDVRLEISRIRLGQARTQTEKSNERTALVQEASLELDGAPEDKKNTPKYQMARVNVLFASGQRADARKLVEKSRDQYPQEVAFWQVLARFAADDGKPADGLAILDAATAKLGNRIELKRSRIYFLLEAKSPPEAFRPLEAGIDELEANDRTRLLGLLAEAYRLSNAPAESERLLRKIVAYRPNDIDALSQLFDLAYRKGDSAEIGELVDKLRRAEGEDGVAWRLADASRHWLQYQKDKSSTSSLIGAKNMLDDAGKRRPNWYRVPLMEAEIEQATGQVEVAIEKYKSAIRLGARFPEVVRRTVKLLVDLRRYDEAREQLLAAGQESSVLAEELGRTAVELAVVRKESAERTFEMAEKAVPKNSTDYRDHLWRGQILMSVKRTNEAEAAFRRAVELEPTAPETWVSLVLFLAGNERVVDAKKEIEKFEKAAISIAPEKRNRTLAPCYEAVGNKVEAEKYYALLAKESPNDLGILRSQAKFYVSTGDVEKATPILRRMVDLSAFGSESRLWSRRSLATTLFASGDFARGTEALSLIDLNLRDKPGNYEDLRVRAMIQALRPGSRQKSIQDLEDSFAKFLPTPQEEFMLARLYELDGNWLKAKDRFEGLFSKPGGRVPAYYAHYIRSLLKRDDLSSAASWFNRLSALEPSSQSPFVVDIKARLLVKQGKKSEAASLLKTFAGTIYQDKKNPNVFRDVGRLLAELKLTVDAEELLRQYVKEAEPKSPAAVLVLAEFLARDDRVGEAIQLCSKSLKSAGPELTALIAVSAVRLGQAKSGDYTAANAVIDEAIRQKPQSIDLKISLAEFKDAQGRYGEAIESYRAIVAREPNNDIALNNLAWLLAFQDGKAGEALVHIDSAIKAAGGQPNLLDTRGVILLMLGRAEEAIATLGESVERSRTPEAYYHLALAHFRAKQTLEAQRTMRQAKEAGFTKKNLHPLETKAYDEFVKAIGEE